MEESGAGEVVRPAVVRVRRVPHEGPGDEGLPVTCPLGGGRGQSFGGRGPS